MAGEERGSALRQGASRADAIAACILGKSWLNRRAMASIYEEITDQMKTAMRGKDTVALGALRGLKTALQNAQIAKGNVHDELPQEEVMTVIRKQIKQREDSIAMFEQAGRAEAADKEKAEIAVLSAFLPKEMDEAEILPILEAVIAELGAATKKDMGRVMKEMQARTEGRAPGKVLSKLVGARLS